jgi:rRNA biogenesis protein RRP5
MTKLKSLTAHPSFWLNYATFLMTTQNQPVAARAILLRATQSVPAPEHRALTAKFGALEFSSPNGDAERGRTVFEGLLGAYPRRSEIWDMYVDLERGRGEESEERVRGLYERMAGMKMKKRRAMFVFKRWLQWEETIGNEEGVQKVKDVAAEYARKLKERQDHDQDDDDE